MLWTLGPELGGFGGVGEGVIVQYDVQERKKINLEGF